VIREPISHDVSSTEHSPEINTAMTSKNERTIFLTALEIEPPTQREAYLDEACGGDESLRQSVAKLLWSHEEAAEQFLRPPVATASGTELDAVQGEASRLDNRDGQTEMLAKDDRLPYFGDYQILGVMARGGMGVVYRARQTSLGRIVALKTILAEQFASDQDVRRFRGEAQAAATLDHPGIVPIYEVGECDGRHYYSMALIEGDSLAARIIGGPLEAREAARFVEQTAAAVAYAHSQGVIHRDIKPANILIDAAGDVRVTDFGLAKLIEGDHDLTVTGQVLGTPGYMAPEQAEGKKGKVEAAIDVYGLGAVLYALLTGRPPFQSESMLETLRLVRESAPVNPQLLNPQAPRDLETICLKCLEKHPQRRYQAAADVQYELQRYLRSEPIQARPASWVYRSWRWCRRRPAAAAASALLCLLFVIVIVAYGLTSRANRRMAASLYANRITNAAQELELDNRNEAIWTLAAAPAAHRGWEWDYLAGEITLPDTSLGSSRYNLIDGRLVDLETIPGTEVKPAKRSLSADGRWLSEVKDEDKIQITELANGKQVLLDGSAGQSSSYSSEGFTPDGAYFVSASFELVPNQTKDPRYPNLRPAPSYRLHLKTWKVGEWTLIHESHQDISDRMLPSSSRRLVAVVVRSKAEGNNSLIIRSTIDGGERFRRTAKYFEGGDPFRYRSWLKAICYGDECVIFKAREAPITLWTPKGEQELLDVDQARGERYIGSVLSFDESLVAIGVEEAATRSVTLHIFDTRSGRNVSTIRTALRVGLVTFHPGRPIVALAQAGHDLLSSEISLWSIETGQLQHILRPHVEPTEEEVSRRQWNQWYASAERLLPGILPEVSISPSILWGAPMRVGYHRLAFSNDGSRLHAAAPKAIHTWQLPSARSSLDYPASRIDFVDDGEALVLSCLRPREDARDSEQVLRLLTMENGRFQRVSRLTKEQVSSCQHVLDRHPPDEETTTSATRQTISSVRSRDDRWLVRYTPPSIVPLMGFAGEGTLEICDARKNVRWRTLQGHGIVTAMAISDDGKLVATAAYSELPRDISIFSVGVDFGTDTRRRSAVIHLWNTRTGRKLGTLRGHIGVVSALAISPDGRRLASVGTSGGLLSHRSYDQRLGEVVIWDLLNEQRLLTMHTDDPRLCCAAFSPDGKLLAAAGESLHFWDGTDLATRRARLKNAIAQRAMLGRPLELRNAAEQ
jgi:WD40 repeat protein